eukprot:COSAG02_NODE_3678_length_6391_cov_3.177845_4_plen_79_part_00
MLLRWPGPTVCCGDANSTYMPVPKANVDYSLQWDVTALQKAFNSCNDNEDVVVRVVCSRTAAIRICARLIATAPSRGA